MFKKCFRLIVYIFLLFSGHFVHANALIVHSNQSSTKKHASFSSISKNDREYQLLNSSNTPIQVTNLPRHKSVHYLQFLQTGVYESAAYNKYLTFTCGEYSSGLSLFRKLILFPFHVFW